MGLTPNLKQETLIEIKFRGKNMAYPNKSGLSTCEDVLNNVVASSPIQAFMEFLLSALSSHKTGCFPN